MRTATIERKTKETVISATVNLDGTGVSDISTGIGFLDHMVEQIARHALIDLTVQAKGDLHIDFHHTTEDTGIVIGEAFHKALGDRAGITRFGEACVPLDEALTRVVLDLSGRPGFEYDVAFNRDKIGEFDVDLFYEFFQGLVNHAGISLHIDNIKGRNAHHIAETMFKGFGRALRMAVTLDQRALEQLPSTKGSL